MTSITVEIDSAVGPRVIAELSVEAEDIESALPAGWTVGDNWQNGVRLSNGRVSYPLVKG